LTTLPSRHTGQSVEVRFGLNGALGPQQSQVRSSPHITIDGKPPDAAHGVDVDADGNGTVTAQRLYQLVRDPSSVTDHTFEIRFLGPGVQAYAFTFG
jgi:hypothetical protein